MPCDLKQLGELGDRGRFAAAVDAADHDHGRPGFGEADRGLVLGHQVAELLLPGVEDLLERDDAAAEVGGHLVDDLLDRVVAHVGLEQDGPHLVEERLVDQPALGS